MSELLEKASCRITDIDRSGGNKAKVIEPVYESV